MENVVEMPLMVAHLVNHQSTRWGFSITAARRPSLVLVSPGMSRCKSGQWLSAAERVKKMVPGPCSGNRKRREVVVGHTL